MYALQIVFMIMIIMINNW